MYEYKAIVREVYDGDTIRADIDLGFGVWKSREKIRLAYINTPELRGEERDQGLIARDRLRELILGKEITLKTLLDKQEKYGRYLGVIFVEGLEKSINDLLVEEGLAVYY